MGGTLTRAAETGSAESGERGGESALGSQPEDSDQKGLKEMDYLSISWPVTSQHVPKKCNTHWQPPREQGS